jgi:hypothetical protein
MIHLIRRIFGHKGNAKDPLIEMPENWNLTRADLSKALETGKRKKINGIELAWASEYERSLLPSWYKYPKKGDLFEANENTEIEFLTAWRAPYTGGGKAILYKGERIWVDYKPIHEKPIGVFVLPVEYKILEERMVPEKERSSSKYNGFYLNIGTKELNEQFSLVQENFSKEKYE